ncbi:MAG: hypothetical protein KAW56_07280 [Candidatus Marinimicrobia bacterium]|nr:hypothetical protein [Candidatus Neomarinimicrobiota bacterium]
MDMWFQLVRVVIANLHEKVDDIFFKVGGKAEVILNSTVHKSREKGYEN